MKKPRVTLEEAIDRVYERLSRLSSEEFERQIGEHENGDLANILRETRALRIREVEALAFEEVVDESSLYDRLNALWSVETLATCCTPSGYDTVSCVIPRQLEIFTSSTSFWKDMRLPRIAAPVLITRHLYALDNMSANVEDEQLLAA
jgi:hypothetical protein